MRETTDQNTVNARIGYLLRMYPRFSQTFIVNEICELERQGLGVGILALRKPNDGIFHESICRVRARAYYAPSTYRGRMRKVTKRQWSWFRRSGRRYWRAVRALRSDKSAEWFDLDRATYLLEWTREHDIAHIHVHFGTTEATVALLANILGGLSYSLTLHAFDIFRRSVDRALLAEKINHSQFTVTVSQYNRHFMVKNLSGVDPDKIRVNYNGINLGRFRPGEGGREPFTLFGLGRLKEKKGFIHLIRAVRRLRDEGLAVKCRIGGEGPDEGRLRQALKQWNLEPNVELLGPLSEERVRALMQRSWCFVLPCVEAEDGNVDALPTVLLESLASGCPSVSTRLSGVPEIIEDEVSGILVKPGDDKALARALRRVLTDDETAGRLSRCGRSRAEERFDIQSNVAVMHEWFKDVIMAPRPVHGAVGRRAGPAGPVSEEDMSVAESTPRMKTAPISEV